MQTQYVAQVTSLKLLFDYKKKEINLFGISKLSPSGKIFSDSPCHFSKGMLRSKVQTSGTYLKQRGKDKTKEIEQQLLSQ